MNIQIALDSERRRDLKLYAGDETTLAVTVYQSDGDSAPITATVMSITTAPDDLTVPVGSQFTVPSDFPGRRWYWLKGEIGGVLTTLAYGLMEICGGQWDYPSGTDYGWYGRYYGGHPW